MSPMLGCATLAPLFGCDPLPFHDVYATGMRSSLFTGFLTLSGFLLTAKTFLVVNMNKEVYANDHYLENCRVQQQLDASLEVYGPLNKIARLLHWNIVLALTAAVTQFTIGFIPSDWTTGLAVALAGAAIAYLCYSLLQVRDNLRRMFAFMEAVARSKIAELEKKAQKAKEERRAAREVEPVREAEDVKRDPDRPAHGEPVG